MMIKKLSYKAWADAELLTALNAIDSHKFPGEQHMALRLFNHVNVVDQIFIGHITGNGHGYTKTNTDSTPTLAELSERVSNADHWLIEFVKTVDEVGLQREINFTFTDGDEGRMTVAEVLDHLVIHGTYHRGNIGMLLSDCGLARPADIYTRFLHLRGGS
ncbi:DinB family protein [Teredinibacter turnerae]|uniref:DinB family protein n=1 Tax=Teredinibacter turnerae TaxID=2426 RepID=UPI0030D56A5E